MKIINLKITYIISCLFTFKLIVSDNVKVDQQNNFLHISDSCSKFTTSLFQELILDQQTAENIAVSSLSTYIILLLLLHGSAGKTREEIKSTLQLHDLEPLQKELNLLFKHLNKVKDVELQFANAIYIDSNFELEKEFLSKSQNHLQASIEKMIPRNRVGSVKQINKWVNEKTKNKISHIINIDDIDEYTKVILINALYFKSSWLNPFESHLTEIRIFHNINNIETSVPTMHKTFNVLHGYIESFESSFIKMKYLTKEFEMIIILPNKKNGLSKLEKTFDWNKIVNSDCFTKEVELFLPKFKIEDTINLKYPLKQLGINSMFTDKANFSLMAKKSLHVDKILQKVVVEVDEKGSEAAAATVAQIRSRRMITDTETFTVDHPFMFIIHHKPSSIPLFIGSIRKLGETLKDEL